MAFEAPTPTNAVQAALDGVKDPYLYLVNEEGGLRITENIETDEALSEMISLCLYWALTEMLEKHGREAYAQMVLALAKGIASHTRGYGDDCARSSKG